MVRLVYALRDRSGTLTAGFEQDAALLTTVWWGRGEAARHGGETPFLHIGFNEHESHLTKIHVDRTRTVGTNGWEQVLGAVIVNHILKLLAVAREEDRSRSRSITDPDHVALEEWGSIWGGCEWLIISAVARRLISNGCLVVTYNKVMGVSRAAGDRPHVGSNGTFAPTRKIVYVPGIRKSG